MRFAERQPHAVPKSKQAILMAEVMALKPRSPTTAKAAGQSARTKQRPVTIATAGQSAR